MSTAHTPTANPLLTLLDLVPSPVILFSPDGHVAFANRSAKSMSARPLLSLPGDPNVRDLVHQIGAGKLVPRCDIQIDVNSDEGIETLRCECAPRPIAGLVAMSVTRAETPRATAPVVPESGDEGRRERLTLQQIMELIKGDLMPPIGAVLGETRSLSVPAPGAALPGLVQTLHERLERLSDLVNVFGEDVLIGDDRMLLPDLVREVCQALAPLCQDKGVSFIIDDGQGDLPPVYGSRRLIRRALHECLHNAVEHSRQATVDEQRSAVKIGFVASGTHLLVSVRNLGVLSAPALRRYADTLFRAEPSGGGVPPSPAALRIGLPLTQRILQLHGGRLKMEDNADELDVLLELPTGAPLRNLQQLDLLQAQIYAEDLSKLMARSRRTA